MKYYYLAFFETPVRTILAELINYKRGDDPYDDDFFLQFQGNVLDFWESTMGIGPELAKVAIHIHSICVNSALVERLWSLMGFFHTNKRNRLDVNTNLTLHLEKQLFFRKKNLNLFFIYLLLFSIQKSLQ